MSVSLYSIEYKEVGTKDRCHSGYDLAELLEEWFHAGENGCENKFYVNKDDKDWKQFKQKYGKKKGYINLVKDMEAVMKKSKYDGVDFIFI